MDLENLLLTFDNITENNKILETFRREIFDDKSDSKNIIIKYFDENDKNIASAELHTIGLMYPEDNIWVWAWSVYYLPKNQILLSRKILNYGLDFLYDEYYYKLMKENSDNN